MIKKMSNQKVKQAIVSFLRNEGITFHGVASFNQKSSEKIVVSPQSLLENASSIICYGMPIPKGVIYAKNNSLELYWRYCNTQYRILDSISNKLSSFLEERYVSAMPLYS